MCVSVCVCVCEREKEKERDRVLVVLFGSFFANCYHCEILRLNLIILYVMFLQALKHDDDRYFLTFDDCLK